MRYTMKLRKKKYMMNQTERRIFLLPAIIIVILAYLHIALPYVIEQTKIIASLDDPFIREPFGKILCHVRSNPI